MSAQLYTLPTATGASPDALLAARRAAALAELAALPTGPDGLPTPETRGKHVAAANVLRGIDKEIEAARREIAKAEARDRMLLKVDAALKDGEPTFVAADEKFYRYGGGEWTTCCRRALAFAHPAIAQAEGWNAFNDLMIAQGRVKRRAVSTLGPVPDDALNLMRRDGWVLPDPDARPEDVPPLFDLLMTSLGGGKPAAREHIERCILWKVLHPEDVFLPAICLSGAGGAGKNLFAEKLAPTLWPGATIALGLGDVFGQYNGLVGRRAFVMVNEAVDEKADAEAVKRMIGSTRFAVNEKFGPKYEANMTAWFWMASNSHRGPIALEGDDVDRRFSVIKLDRPLWWFAAKAAGALDADGEPDRAAGRRWIDREAKCLTDPRHVAAWLGVLAARHRPATDRPQAFHEADYDEIREAQVKPSETAFRLAFDFAPAEITHWSGRDLCDLYRYVAERDAPGQRIMGRNSLMALARDRLRRARGCPWREVRPEAPVSVLGRRTTGFVRVACGSTITRNDIGRFRWAEGDRWSVDLDALTWVEPDKQNSFLRPLP